MGESIGLRFEKEAHRICEFRSVKNKTDLSKMFLQIEEEGIQICCAVNTIHKHKKTMTLSDFFVTGKTHNKHEKHIKGNTNCYRCGKPGHGRSQCKETKYRLKQGRRDFSLHRNVSVDQAIDILKEYDIEHRINRTKKKDMAKSNSKKMKFQLNTKEFDALPGTKKNPAASGPLKGWASVATKTVQTTEEQQMMKDIQYLITKFPNSGADPNELKTLLLTLNVTELESYLDGTYDKQKENKPSKNKNNSNSSSSSNNSNSSSSSSKRS